MKNRIQLSRRFKIAGVVLGLLLISTYWGTAAFGIDMSQLPLFLTQDVPPLNLLVLGRDHKLYYEAYNDASDLNGDGKLDIRYDPTIEYYGYFDSFKCYTYDSSESPARFEPTSVTANKTCSGSAEWSGDFLNYLTTARIDALRKVLYGGYRRVDDQTKTVLERSHIPQDAHSWGKEYTSIAVDGYDIRNYTPLNLPSTGTRHLFANTTLLNDSSSHPRLRVLVNSAYRIWEWVSIEQPVAGDQCNDGSGRTSCANSTGSDWQIVPSTMLQDLTQTTYDTSGYNTYPADHSGFDSLISNYATEPKMFGQGSASTINGSGNPFGSDDNYLTVFTGTLVIAQTGTYTFAVDGDDAIELLIDGNWVAGWYNGHGRCNCQSYDGSVYLTAGEHTLEFRHQEYTGGDSYHLYWNNPVAASTMTDYQVRVEVCNDSFPETNCKQYPSGYYKPAGLLQEYGEDDTMMFGLLTGSYAKNTSGGVLRKKVGSFSDEVNADTGQFTAVNGIVKTIDRLKVVGFGGSYTHQSNCGWITTRPINEGECRMWGNPVAEMMYEGMRYFSGQGSPTSDFQISSSSNDDATLGLPLASWDDPYATGNNEYCAKPFQLVISDINPSFDTDQLPGSYFGSFSGDINGLNVANLGQTIWDNEQGSVLNYFIGQSGSNYDGSPSPKSVDSFGNIRGLAPEEPTKRGGYYSAALSLFGHQNDLNPVSDEQTMTTFAVALASPLPEIRIPVGNHVVTLVPFAKSVGGYSINPAQGSFQPTNSIVDYYVDQLSENYGKFRINFEDVEQGADHDMDAIVEYIYEVREDGTLSVTLNSIYAAGSIIQHIGYVISGTSADGTYLEVRDSDTAESSDPDYFLDTPYAALPGVGWDDNRALPLSNTRVFTPTGSANAGFLRNPLWYAAKYGKFKDINKNGLPDADEWDTDKDGKPDNYFLVTNALTLKDQLSDAFSQILGLSSSAAATSTNSVQLNTDTLIYQARFNSEDWTGELLAYPIDLNGNIGNSIWDAGLSIPNWTERKLFTYSGSAGMIFNWTNLTAVWGASPFGLNEDQVNYLRGDSSNEQANGGAYRNRKRLLGDIVHSDPQFVYDQDDGYEVLAGTEGSDYKAYRASDPYKNRSAMLYVGANDGMLHALDAKTGVEKFAYVPLGVSTNLTLLTQPTYGHNYYVNGPSHAYDAYLEVGGFKQWRTVLLGSLGAGGRTVFALDVTAPDSFNASDVLWEFPASDPGISAAELDLLGEGIDDAWCVRLANGEWGAIFANGYNSTSNQAALFIVNMQDGTVMRTINTGVGSEAEPNGLSAPTPVDYNGDGIVDAVYAGDLRGNLWKFDLSDSLESKWDIAFSKKVSGQTTYLPLFTARGPSGEVQPITSAPEVSTGPDGTTDQVMVFFGTGRFFAVGDNLVNANPDVQTMYGILDTRESATGEIDRSSLVAQAIILENNEHGEHNRVLSNNTFSYASGQMGWYLDLISPVNGAEGERVVEAPVLSNGVLFYVTMIPSGSPCKAGGDSWLMITDPLTGGRLSYSVFDLNGDGLFDEGDYVTVIIDGKETKVASSGLDLGIGILTSPNILGAGTKNYVISSGSSGDLGIIGTGTGSNSGAGRSSWRQIR
ncbi:MAG: PilC/PilY family type IV pilus protein [Syntrophotaleaceae bacterium]